jgi:hypothetical protein
MPEAVSFESRRQCGFLDLRIVARFGFGRWNVSDRLQQPLVVEPVDPLERGELDRLEFAPRPSSPDDLGFVESVDRLGERIVVAVADAADRWFDARVFQALDVFYGEILASAIRVMDEAAAVNRPARRTSKATSDRAAMNLPDRRSV